MKRSKAQLRAISNSYTKKRNKEAYARMQKWFDETCEGFPFSSLDFFLKMCKLSYGLKTKSYVVLEKALIKREVIY